MNTNLPGRIEAALRGTGGDLDRAIIRAVGTVREFVQGEDEPAARVSHHWDSGLMADIAKFRAGDCDAWNRATNGGEWPLLRA